MPFKYSAKGIQMGTTYDPAPEGIYNLIIETAEEGMTKNNDPMVTIKCSIEDNGPYFGYSIWNRITFFGRNADGTAKKGAGIALHFLSTIGEPFEDDFDVIPSNWIGKKFRATVGIEEYNGVKRNKIKYVLPKESPDEVPF